MARKVSRWTKFIKATEQHGLKVIMTLVTLLIIAVAGVATFNGALTTSTAFGWTGIAAYAVSALPDALMVLSSARQRQQGITKPQRQTAQRWMRFGLGIGILANMIAAFLIKAPTGYWVNYDNPRAVWMQHVIFGLSIFWHVMPVLILFGATEILTRPRQEPASIEEGKIINRLLSMIKPPTSNVPEQRKRKISALTGATE